MKTFLNHKGLLAGAVCLATALPGMVAAQDYTMKIGHVSAPSTEADDHLMALFLKSYVESHSQGRIAVEIYPSGQLGNFREMLEQVNNNTLEFTSTTVGGIASFFPEIQVTDLPYTLRDDVVAERMMTSPIWSDVREAILEKTGNIRLMAVGNTGSWRNFATTDVEVHVASDLEGLKIRTISSDLQVEFVRQLGASATPIPWNELYTSLSTGVVDGTKNAIGDYIPQGMNEPLSHIVLDGHTYIYGFNWMSDAWLQSLPQDLQNVVVDAVVLSVGIQTNFNKSFQSLASETWLEGGNTIYVPTAEEKATFLGARDSMRDWYSAEFGNEWLDKWLAAVADVEAAIDADRAAVLGH